MNDTHNGAGAVGRRPALVVLATSQFLLVLDTAIVNVALPSIQSDLRFGQGGVTWVVNAYTLLFGGLLLLGGRLADVLGARRVFLAGSTLFGLASAAGALAPSGEVLVAARAVQGLAASLVAPGAMAMALILFEPGRTRNRALGLLGAAAGLGGASGAVAGGVLTQIWGWPAILWINVPIVTAMVGLSLCLLPADGATGDLGAVDLGGAATATVGLVGVVYGLLGVAEAGWTSPRTIVPLVLGVVLLGVFVAVERRVDSPLVPASIVAVSTLRGANAALVFSSMAMMPMWFLLTVYLQQVLGFGPVAAGAGVLPTVAMLVLFNSLAPRAVARLGTKRPLVAGLTCAAAGLAWSSALGGPGAGFVEDMVLPQLVTGMGFGLAFVAGTVTATKDVPMWQSGIASGLLNTAQQLGGAIGLAVVVTVASGVGGADAVALTADLSQGFRVAALSTVVAAAVAMVLVPGRPQRAKPPTAAPTGSVPVDASASMSA